MTMDNLLTFLNAHALFKKVIIEDNVDLQQEHRNSLNEVLSQNKEFTDVSVI